jgi:hypothetical protein
MGVGPNYVLDKGHVATGSTAYAFGELVTPVANAATPNASTAVARATTANVLTPIYVCQEDLDTTRLATGKAVVDCRLLGISRVLSGAAVSVHDRVTNDTTARAVTRTRAAAGAQPAATFGIALTAATAAGQYIDVLLTPGATF